MSITQIPAIPDIDADNQDSVQAVLESMKEILEIVLARRGSNTDLQILFKSGGSPSFTEITKIGEVDNYTQIGPDGTVYFKGKATTFDDLQVSFSSVRLPGVNDPTWRLYDHGVAAGETFPVLGFSVNNIVFFDIQSRHAMKLSTVLDNHIHYMTPTDGTGDRFQFQLDVIAAPIDGIWAVPTGSPFTKEVTMTADLSNAHKIVDIADIPAVNTTISTLYKCKLTRIAATVDEYAGEVYLEFADCHYERDMAGSSGELFK